MGQVSTQIIVATITGITGLFAPVVKEAFEARQRHRAVLQDLELLATLPLNSPQRGALQEWIDAQVRRYIQTESEHKRSWFEVVVGLLFLIPGGLLAWTIKHIGGWAWTLTPFAGFLLLFGLVGLVQGLQKKQRDQKGHAIKEEDKLKHTRVGLPEDKYLQRIGEIAYAASYIEWTLLGDIPRLQDRLPDDFCLEKLESKTTGSIAKAAQEAAKQCQDGEVRAYLEVMGKALSTMAEIRNDVLHARPATYDTTSGTQRLFRAKVDTTRKPTGERIWIDEKWLDEQVDRINQALDDIEAVRPPFKK